jgi:S-adenosylmethionine decarboxylase proenzyme
MKTRGRHLLLELSGSGAHALNDRELVGTALREAAAAAGATIVSESLHGFSPHGLTGIILLAESHISIHTWPEAGYAAVDLYTCGECRPERAVEVLTRHLGAERVEVMWIDRGLGPEESELQLVVRAHEVRTCEGRGK